MQMNLPQFLKNYRNKTVNDLYNRAFTNLSHSLCENKALIFIGFLYFLTTIIIHCFFNKKIIENLAFYYSLVNNLYILFFSTFGCFFLLSKIKNFGLPVTLKQTVYAISFSKYFFNFIIIYILFPIFFFSYSSIKQIIPYFFSFNFKHDYLLAKIDYILHMNNHPWEILHPIIGHPLITIVIDRLYIYWGIIFFFTVMYMAFHKNFVLRKRFFITLCFSWIFIGNILAAFFFSAGPCYFKEVTGIDNNAYTELFLYLKSIPGLNAIRIQEHLWSSFSENIFMPLGGISAMPSMHVSVATLLALLYLNLNKFFGTIMIIYALLIQIGSVHLGWHYAVDGYISSTVTIILWLSHSFFQKIYPVKKLSAQKHRTKWLPEVGSRTP